MKIEQSRKAGIASGIARQSPELSADKIRAIELHKIGMDTGAINRALPLRQRTEIRCWLIAAGIYTTKGRGKANAGKRHFNAERLIATQYANDTKQSAPWDDCAHWRRHPAFAARSAFIHYWKHNARILSRLSERYKTEPLNKRLRRLLANRISHAIKRNGKPTRKGAKTMQLIGCTIADLRVHIERQFTAGMTWTNYGRNGWHIDHRRPCASFDLTDAEQQRICFHHSNLQPLWEADNLRKSDKWID